MNEVSGRREARINQVRIEGPSPRSLRNGQITVQCGVNSDALAIGVGGDDAERDEVADVAETEGDADRVEEQRRSVERPPVSLRRRL